MTRASQAKHCASALASKSIAFKSSVEHDLKRLDRPVARRLLDQLERVLADDPDAGEPLRGEFRGLYKYRVGDYRVVYTKTADGVLVLRIGHRKDVYR